MEKINNVGFYIFFVEFFTYPWEQRRLVEVTDVRDGTHSSPKYVDYGFPLVTSKNLKENGIDMSEVSYISNKDYIEINKRSKVDEGDIIFAMIGTIGNPVIIEDDNIAIKNVALLKKSIYIDNNFLLQLLKSNVFSSYVTKENMGGTQKFLALHKIRNFVFYQPILKEQRKIAHTFIKLDQLITLHQCEPILKSNLIQIIIS